MSEQETPRTPALPGATVPAGAVGAPATAIVAGAPVAPAAPAQRGLRRVFLINGLGLLAVILIGLGIFYLWHQGYYFYSTDDAKVDGAIVAAAPPVPGTVNSVAVAVGSTVRSGDTIATLTSATGRTVRVASPIDGSIIAEGATQGEVLPAGQPLAQVVDLNHLHITAYVEENHIKDVSTGQGVDVKVDAVSDTTLHGAVTRILPVAASELSAIPSSDNATGNFTKVTQRVPVQITLDGYQGHTLYPGESATITIHIHS